MYSVRGAMHTNLTHSLAENSCRSPPKSNRRFFVAAINGSKKENLTLSPPIPLSLSHNSRRSDWGRDDGYGGKDFERI